MNRMKKALYTAILWSSTVMYPSPSVITFFLQPYPQAKIKMDEKTQSRYSKKLKQPGYLLKKIVKKNRIETGVAGVMCLHLGYTNTSDHNGKVTFPRKQQKSTVNILITRGIKPVYMIAPDTIHNWMLDTQEPAQMYELSLKRDQETGLYYINAKKAELPNDHTISLNTIVIIAHPKNVFIPEGATISHYGTNLILPPVYIKKNFNFTYNALYTLSIKQYFETIALDYKQEDQTVSMITI